VSRIFADHNRRRNRHQRFSLAREVGLPDKTVLTDDKLFCAPADLIASQTDRAPPYNKANRARRLASPVKRRLQDTGDAALASDDGPIFS